MKISAILLAAGEGRRLGSPTPKAFTVLEGREMFLHSLELFERVREISEVILVVPKSEIVRAKKLAANFKKVKKIMAGGATRQKSLARGLKLARGDYILSHNAANPFATKNEISKLAETLQKHDAAAVARRAESTVRQNCTTLERAKIWLMETPQISKKEFLTRGLEVAHSQKIETTDEIQLAELVGARIKILVADSKNRKITRAEDLPKENRVGLGHDSHRFSKISKPLFLGGVKISVRGGLAGNSDGDALLHSLTNALSSALGGGSLSTFADGMCRRGIRDSQKYLAVMLQKMRAAGFEILNLSVAVEAKQPRLEKHFPKIRRNLAQILKISPTKIGLTATTGEGLTAFGRGEGVQVFSLILLQK